MNPTPVPELERRLQQDYYGALVRSDQIAKLLENCKKELTEPDHPFSAVSYLAELQSALEPVRKDFDSSVAALTKALQDMKTAPASVIDAGTLKVVKMAKQFSDGNLQFYNQAPWLGTTSGNEWLLPNYFDVGREVYDKENAYRSLETEKLREHGEIVDKRVQQFLEDGAQFENEVQFQFLFTF